MSWVMSESITTIGSRAFERKELTSVTIPGSVTSIGDYAFANNRLSSVTIPSSVTSIGDSAFANNRLTNVIIPEGVTSIGAHAFQNNLLTSVTIPSSVTSIGDYAFDYWRRYQEEFVIIIGAGVNLASSRDNFTKLYNENGKKAGTYRNKGDSGFYFGTGKDMNKWVYSP